MDSKYDKITEIHKGALRQGLYDSVLKIGLAWKLKDKFRMLLSFQFFKNFIINETLIYNTNLHKINLQKNSLYCSIYRLF